MVARQRGQIRACRASGVKRVPPASRHWRPTSQSDFSPLRTLRTLILERQLPLVGAPRGRRHPAVAHAGAVYAERVDCPAVLAQGSGRGSRCVRCALCAQTTAARMTTKRAARADPWAAFLGAPEIAPAGRRLPRGWVVGARWSGPRQPERQKPGRKSVWGPLAAHLLGRRGAQGLRPGAQRRSSTFSSRLSERRERSERSEFRDGAQDRAPQGSRRVQRTTAPVKRRQRPPHAFAARLLVFWLSGPGPPNTEDPASRQAVPGGGDFWGAEERSPGVGARSALRCHSGRGCPSAESAANAASSAARPLGEYRRAVDAFSGDRPSMSHRQVPPGARRANER